MKIIKSIWSYILSFFVKDNVEPKPLLEIEEGVTISIGMIQKIVVPISGRLKVVLQTEEYVFATYYPDNGDPPYEIQMEKEDFIEAMKYSLTGLIPHKAPELKEE